MKLIRQTALRFTEGNSDKVYEVDIVETSGEYLVNFRYGKYTSNLREGCKTKSPVELSQATKIADSILVSKINKGYQVVAGYDPVSKETIGGATQQSTPQTSSPPETTSASAPIAANERDQKIIQRLEAFCRANEKEIDGYNFGRTIWKAGELRIKAARPILEKIFKTDAVDKDSVNYYSILWALGRIGDKASLPLIDAFEDKIPDNTEYMLTEIKIALSSNPEEFIPSYDETLNIVDTSAEISQFEQIQNMSFDTLDENGRKYVYAVMNLHGLTQEVDKAIAQLTIKDVGEDYFSKYLSEETVNKINKNTAAFPNLENAYSGLLEHKHNTLITEKLVKYKPDFDRYQSVIADLDLNKIFEGEESDINAAETGRLGWLWGSEKKRFRKALNKHPNVGNVQSLWQLIENYSDISSDIYHTYTDEDISRFNQEIQQAGVADDVLNHIDTSTLQDSKWSFSSGLSLDTRSKYDSSIEYRVNALFKHRFSELREKALKPKKKLTSAFQLSSLGLYWSSLADKSLREKNIAAIKNTPVTEPFTQTFRRLYKIAEFRDDAEVLAILNYRIEATTPSPSSYWSKSKPFSKKTKEYFRRRFVRSLRNIAKFQPNDYTQFAKHALLQADDQDNELVKNIDKYNLRYFPRLSAMNYILHDKSILLRPNYLNIWLKQRDVKKDIARTEAHPTLWDQAPQDLLDLLLCCKARIVNDFAYNRLENKADFLKDISKKDWMLLVQRPYENTALLALEHLKDSLSDTDVMKVVLNAQFSSVREEALKAIDGESLGKNIDLLVLMLLSEHDDVYEFAKSYLYTAEKHYTDVSDQLLSELLAADKLQHEVLISRVKWLLLHPLKGKASLKSITPLLAKTELEMQLLGANLLETSDYSFAEMEQSYQLMSQSEYPEIRAGAIALLAKLSTAEKIKHKDLLFSALLDEHAALRQKSRDVVATIDDQPFRIETFDHVLPTFFKSEPVEGFADDMLELVVVLEPMHKDVDINLLWRLMTAKAKLAEWVGAVVLPSRNVNEFSVKQLSLLSKNPTLSIRDWSLTAFEKDLSLSKDNYSQAIRILDNPWDDTRTRAITFFQDNFDDAFWNSQRTIAVCDNVYADVQRFGRDLVTRFFNDDQGEEYLIKLSQHPSANVQLFVSGFLKEYATDKVDIIVSLQPYFKTVLSQVNRGRLVKDRIIKFLFEEAEKQQKVATMVAELFSDQSVSMVIADKMQYIKTLYKLQKQFTQIQTPVVTIEPEVRSI